LFVPLFGWYRYTETQAEFDNSVYEEVSVTSNAKELERIMRDYVHLPRKCIAGGNGSHSHFVEEGEEVSDDQLTDGAQMFL